MNNVTLVRQLTVSNQQITLTINLENSSQKAGFDYVRARMEVPVVS